MKGYLFYLFFIYLYFFIYLFHFVIFPQKEMKLKKNTDCFFLQCILYTSEHIEKASISNLHLCKHCVHVSTDYHMYKPWYFY